MSSIFSKVTGTLADILDIEAGEIDQETYLIRDLEAESIDLLELAVTLNSEFQIEIDDDEIFLKMLRIYLDEPEKKPDDMQAYLMEKYPFLSASRIREILKERDNGPVLKVKDLISYIKWKNR